MNLTGIISISGKPGLSKILSQSKNGLIVESLNDGKRFPVHGTEKISSIEDISIYTYGEDILLKEVFEKILEKEKGGKAIDHKSDNEKLKSYFEEVLPDYDKERVYTSDIKKIFQWYNQLHEIGLLEKEEEEDKKEKETKGSEKKSTTKKKVAEAKKSPSNKAGNKPAKTSGQKGGSKVSTPRKAN